jgi:hypothetical protein
MIDMLPMPKGRDELRCTSFPVLTADAELIRLILLTPREDVPSLENFLYNPCKFLIII